MHQHLVALLVAVQVVVRLEVIDVDLNAYCDTFSSVISRRGRGGTGG
jgi:hypothetical protein